MKTRFAIVFYIILISLPACAENEHSNSELTQSVVNQIYKETKCPIKNTWFGSIDICVESITVADSILIKLKPIGDLNANLPLSGISDIKELNNFLENVVCNGVSGSLGVSDDAVLNKKQGIVQRSIKDALSLNAESYEKFNYDFSSKVTYELALKSERQNIKLIWHPHSEARKHPHRCDISIKQIDKHVRY